jgi:hypothetical protein
MARSAPARKPDPVSALLALRMQARGFARGWSVSPYRVSDENLVEGRFA